MIRKLIWAALALAVASSSSSSLGVVAAPQVDLLDGTILDDRSQCFPEIVPGPWQKSTPAFEPLRKIENQSATLARIRGSHKFQWETALYLMRLSYPSYKLFCDDAQAMNIPGTRSHGLVYGYEGVDESRHVTFGEVIETDNAIILFLRGTISVDGWLTDATAWTTSDTDDFPGEIHKGFWKAYSTSQMASAADIAAGHGDKPGHEVDPAAPTMRTQAAAAVRAALKESPNKPVYVSGHSLGAGLAVLVSFGLKMDLPHADVFMMTMAGPRVGNAEFAGAYNKLLRHRAWRMVNTYDPVPKIPWMFGKYQHVGSEIEFSRANAPRDMSAFDDVPAAVVKGSAWHMWAYEDECMVHLGMSTYADKQKGGRRGRGRGQ